MTSSDGIDWKLSCVADTFTSDKIQYAVNFRPLVLQMLSNIFNIHLKNRSIVAPDTEKDVEIPPPKGLIGSSITDFPCVCDLSFDYRYRTVFELLLSVLQ